MSYKDKPQIKLYKYENFAFVLQAIIDDFQEISFERNLYQAGTFTITINYNIPNALKFERGMFVQFGNDPYDFGEIITIRDSIGQDGKGSQIRTITGYDSRYILKRRVIKNMNSNGLWNMTAKGELCLRNLIKDQCGSGAEAKRQLPIINTIPASADAIGKEYSVSEQFTNLYEVCKTIATQSEIGWRLAFNGTSLTLECYEGTDRSQTVQFSTSFDSLANGEFSDSSESFSNAIYVGGKGDNEERDIYEGENGTPSGLDRFESFDNQSSMTTEAEYEAEAISMLTQYGQTIQMSGNGLAKCPYIYKEQYDVGDLITVAFSGKSAVVQILSVTEHWIFGAYDIQFQFGKPQPTQSDQLQLMLRKIQSASNKEKATESVKWYNVANVNSMLASDVTFNTIGFTGTLTANKTFTFYLDDEKTGAKSYNIYVKNLSGNFTLTLTTGRSGKTNYVLKGGVNLTGRILVDDEGNITSQSVTATSVIESGNSQPVTSGGVADKLNYDLNYQSSYYFNNNTNNDVIIHLGHFASPNNDNYNGLSIELEMNRADRVSKILAVVSGGKLGLLKLDANNIHWQSEIRLYKIDNKNYDLYLLAKSWSSRNYIKLTSPRNFTYDGSIVTEYSGTQVSPTTVLTTADLVNTATSAGSTAPITSGGIFNNCAFKLIIPSPQAVTRYVKIQIISYDKSIDSPIVICQSYSNILFLRENNEAYSLTKKTYGVKAISWTNYTVDNDDYFWLQISDYRRIELISTNPMSILENTTTQPSGVTFTAVGNLP